jgi:hypothetical protein
VAPKLADGAPVFSCLISTLLEDDEEGNYSNRAFWVEFPPEVILQASGRTIRKAFILGSRDAGPKARDLGPNNDIVRLAQCDMPDSPLADALIDKKLREFGLGSWLAPSSGARPAKHASPPPIPTVSSSWLHCNEWFVTKVCTIIGGERFCYITDVRCIDWVVVWDEPDYGGAGYPDSWWTEFPGEGCEPWELCVLGPEGGSTPVPDNNTCKVTSAPAFCSDPCEDTGDDFVDSNSGQMIMESLAQSSLFGEANILNRLEDGGWLTLTNGLYELLRFPSEWTRLACGIDLPENHVTFIPPNTVAIIHTHPFSEGEDTTSVCGSEGSTSYISGHSEEDITLLTDIQNDIRYGFGFKSYVIDRSNISVYTFYPQAAIERCGY